jgi:hypothetical protein
MMMMMRRRRKKKKKNWKGSGRKWSWPNLTCCTSPFQEGLRETTKSLSQNT